MGEILVHVLKRIKTEKFLKTSEKSEKSEKSGSYLISPVSLHSQFKKTNSMISDPVHKTLGVHFVRTPQGDKYW